ncbi:hypothetical protein F2Q69_00046638 [Brassica cretica]|uniref:Uncharacterized protein n=1 Tax=Brassica cretica TaxID=69181 RepID=A0A8S9Q1T6_BRACR|nr:hypothetical protein F2Q69_00046638 [Brassica cretica]
MGADDSGPRIRGSKVEVGVDGLRTQIADWCSPQISTREFTVGVDWPQTTAADRACPSSISTPSYPFVLGKEPNFQYNNYQQKPFYNNQQGGYQARQNYSQGFSSKGNQSTQGQVGSSTSAPQESSTDAMLKQILESQTRSEKHIEYELKNLHTKAEVQIVEKVEHKIVERVEIQTVKKVEGKVLQPVRHKVEKPVIGKAVTQLKEVQLEEAHVVEQSPYDKLPFPQRYRICMMLMSK